MGLEDIAMFRAVPEMKIYYPSDAVSTEWAVVHSLNYNKGVFIRTNRPSTPVIYPNDEVFEDGKCKVVKEGEAITVIGAGVTLNEALEAHTMLEADGIKITVVDIFCVKPIDGPGIVAAASKTGNKVLVVEDHYPEGGVGEAVMSACATAGLQIHHLAVREMMNL